MLLKGQDKASAQTGLPVAVNDQASRVTAVSGETITLVVASTNANSSGEAAGTVVYARTTNNRILDSAKIAIGNAADSSFAFVTGTILTAQVEFPHGIWEKSEGNTRAIRMAEVGALLSNGQFVLDHRTGLLIGKKATTGNADTANYSYRIPLVTTV